MVDVPARFFPFPLPFAAGFDFGGAVAAFAFADFAAVRELFLPEVELAGELAAVELPPCCCPAAPPPLLVPAVPSLNLILSPARGLLLAVEAVVVGLRDDDGDACGGGRGPASSGPESDASWSTSSASDGVGERILGAMAGPSRRSAVRERWGGEAGNARDTRERVAQASEGDQSQVK